jgi:hypothetical protein
MLGLLLTGILISIPLVPPQVNSPFTLYEYMRANFTYQNEAEGVDDWKEPARTAKDKGGDCEDFALYAEKVLQNLGYDAKAIAIKGRDKFFHAICVVKVEGKYRYFSNQYYSYFKSFESIEEIVTFECENWKWWAEISLPHEIKNFHYQVISGG